MSRLGRLQLRLATVYWRMGGEQRSSAAFCQKRAMLAVKSDSTLAAGWAMLGRLFAQGGAAAAPKAIKCYAKAVELEPSDEAAGNALCDLYEQSAQHELLATTCQRASSRHRGAAWAWRRMGLAAAAAGRHAEAMSSLQLAVRAHPEDGDCWDALAAAYTQQGSYESGVNAYARCVALKASASDVCARERCAMGRLLLLNREAEDAALAYGAVLAQMPRYVPALVGMGEALLLGATEEREFGNLSSMAASLVKAVGHLQAALDIEAEAPEGRQTLKAHKLLGDCLSELAVATAADASEALVSRALDSTMRKSRGEQTEADGAALPPHVLPAATMLRAAAGAYETVLAMVTAAVDSLSNLCF